MFKFIQKEQVNHNIDLPAFAFKGKPLLPAVNALLRARGIKDDEGVRAYFDPKEEDLQDALSLKNIDAAAERLRAAVENGETILIFGDYDADGICAAAILYDYLTGINASVIPYIPDRRDGYGLSVPVIERLAEEYDPDLWLTCDCGISCAAEAGYILDLGMDIIVTDHHELPEILPDCITINPKLSGQGYSYPSLCGAGVALMLVRAMGGREAARRFFGLAAVATIGDMVPLTGENRIITVLGLKQLNNSPAPWLKALAESAGLSFPLSAQDVAFKIVPRLNAAGRMARAADAFDLITTGDGDLRGAFVKKIEEASAQRKAVSEIMCAEALRDLEEEKLYDKYAVVLSSPEWEKGIMGIAAAQLSGSFNRPVFLMAKASGKEYKGTARSIDGINIRDVLAAVSDTLTEYGGHSQAAGFSLPERNIPVFKEKVLTYLKEKAAKELFAYRQDYDAEISEGEITVALGRQLKLFEPFGTDNRPPLFKLKAGKTSVTAMKNREHITVCTEGGLNILGFNCHRLSDIYRSCAQKEMLIEVRANTYMGREELSAVLKYSSCPLLVADIDNGKVLVRHVEQFAAARAGGGNAGALRLYGENGLKQLIAERAGNPYGLIVAAPSYASYKEFAGEYDPCGEAFLHEYLYPGSPNNYNRLIIAPDFNDFRLKLYHTVIFLGSPFGGAYAESLCGGGAEIYAPEKGGSGIADIVKNEISLSRECFSAYYRLFMDIQGTQAPDVNALYEKAGSRATDIKLPQFVVCLYVFRELGLLEYAPDKPLKLLKGKAELKDSTLYAALESVAGENK